MNLIKPDVSKEAIHQFLHGSNPKKHVVKIETSSWGRYASVYSRKDKYSPKIIERVEFTPYLWCKKLENSDFYQYKTIGIPIENYNKNNNKFIYNDEVFIVNDIDIKYLGVTPDKKYAIVSFKNTEEERNRLVHEKMREYGIIWKKLITNYDGKEIQRLEEGYKYSVSIKGNEKGNYHTNPLVAYTKSGRVKKIHGTYQDLLDFFIDGGINPSERSGVFINKEKLDNVIDNATIEDKLRLLFNFYDYPMPTFEDSDLEDLEEETETVESYLPTIFFKFKQADLDYLTYCVNLIEHQVDDVLFDIVYELQSRNISDIVIDHITEYKDDIKNLHKYLTDFKKEIGKNEKIIISDINKSVAICKKKTKDIATIKYRKTLEFISTKGIDFFIDFLKNTNDSTNGRKLIDYFNLKFDELTIKQLIKSRYKLDVRRDFKKRKEDCEKNNLDFFDGVDSFIYKIGTNEQFMIQSGIRLFKDFEKFDDMVQLSFDIETQAQVGFENDPIAALSPFKGRIFAIAMTDNIGNEKFLYSKNDGEERKSIEDFFYYLGYFNPDNVKGHNIEGFDFKMIVDRYGLLTGLWDRKEVIEKKKKVLRTVVNTEAVIKILDKFFKEGLSEHYSEEHIGYSAFQRRDGSLKVGGATENVMQTTLQGMNVCDTIFSTKRQRATNKKIESDALKWNVKFNKLEKHDRVIIKGENNGIGYTMDSKNDFYWNPTTGKYFEHDKSFKWLKKPLNENDIKNFAEKKYYNGEKDNLYCHSYNFLSETDNTFEFKTHFNDVFINDTNLEEFKVEIAKQFTELKQLRLDYKTIYFPFTGICLEWDNNTNTVKTWAYFKSLLVEFINSFKDLSELYNIDINQYEKTTGSFLVNEYLKGDLEDPIKLDDIYSQSSLQISYWLPTNYGRTSTMGGASMWTLILNSWSYLNGLAIPIIDEPRKYLGALVGCFSTGYHGESTKLDLSSLYPSLYLEHCLPPDVDITSITKALLSYTLNTRLECKKIRLEYKAIGDKVNEAKWEKKEIPLKLLNNTFYGWLGFSANPYNSFDVAEWITCNGRQYLRHIMKYFLSKGLQPLNCHTDGILFENLDVDMNYEYIGLGVENNGNWLVTSGKKYFGVEAYVAQYNDEYMKGIMGLDIDDFYASAALFAKGNYLTCKWTKDKNTGKKYKTIDFTGGGIINKASSDIVIDFLIEGKNAHLLMDSDVENNVQVFIQNIIKEQEKIIKFEIERDKIASTVKCSMSNEDYAEHLKKKNKAGKPLPRRVANELSLKYGLDFKVGERIKYINVGKTEMDRDISQDGHLSCILLQDKNVEYNVEKYLKKFTNSMKNLLLCFDKETRKKIIFSKTNKNFWYDKETDSWKHLLSNFEAKDFKLVNKQPMKEADEDSLEDILEITKEEKFFWNKIGYSEDSFLIVK